MHRTGHAGLEWVALLVLAALAASPARAGSEEDLRAEVEALRQRVVELESLVKGGAEHAAPVGAPAADPAAPDSWLEHIRLSGQYRVNAYTVDNDTGGRQTAARVRIRQGLDIRFTERFKTHLQIELGHTNDNTTTTNFSSRETNLAVRHALMDYTFPYEINAQAGIVPLSDRFGDTLFSSDWDYNPVALSLTAPLAGGTLRAFAGNLRELDESDSDDDFVHYQLDYVLPFYRDHQLDFGLTLATIPGPDNDDHVHANYGIGGSLRLTDDLLLRGFLLGSHTEKDLLGTSDDADGLAAKLELISSSGLGLLATYATGDSDGSGFLPVMALAGTYGYWGYTGFLTVQGPTDTGFDFDAVNISNNGFGLATVQVRYARPLTESFDVHLGAGWFGASDTPGGRDSFVGADFLVMGSYHFNSFLALDVGAAYARLGDAVSGYSSGVIGGAGFNQPLDSDRDKYGFFSRLQAEF